MANETNYAVFDHYSGLLWGYGIASDAREACAKADMDANLKEPLREYSECTRRDINAAYHVYVVPPEVDMTNIWADNLDDELGDVREVWDHAESFIRSETE